MAHFKVVTFHSASLVTGVLLSVPSLFMFATLKGGQDSLLWNQDETLGDFGMARPVAF